MATIKTTGTGSGLRIITKTVEGQVLVSCGCCDPCAALPETLTVVFSGIQKCPDSILDVTNGLYEVNLSGSGEWAYNDATHRVDVICFTASNYTALGGNPDYLPNGIAPDDSSTPIFSINYGRKDPEDPTELLGLFASSDRTAFQYASESSAGTSGLVCGLDSAIGYGGTATISWE